MTKAAAARGAAAPSALSPAAAARPAGSASSARRLGCTDVCAAGCGCWLHCGAAGARRGRQAAAAAAGDTRTHCCWRCSAPCVWPLKGATVEARIAVPGAALGGWAGV